MKATNAEQFFAAKPLQFVSGFRHRTQPYCNMHFHQALEIVYHPTGHGTTVLKSGEVVTYAERSVVVYAPRMPHDQTAIGAGEDVCLHVDSTATLPEPLNTCMYVPPVTDRHLIAEMNDLSRLNAAGMNTLQKTALNYRISALLISLLQASTAGGKDPHRPKAERYARAAWDYILAHSPEIRRVDDVAARVGVSADYLRHIFKAQYDVSLAGFLNQSRVERSKDLLTRSTLSLKIIATMCGFDNERYFSHVFKKHEQCTPGEFRSRA